MSIGLYQTLSDPSAASNDYFGSAVAMSDDGTRMIVGAKGDQNNDIGQCHIYLYSGGTWSLEQSIYQDIGGQQDLEFGFSVTINGAGDRVAVGAPDTGDTSTSANDRVYIYSRSGTSWSLTQTIIPSGSAETGKWFGYSVAMSGDGEILLVGIPRYSVGASLRGCVKSYNWTGAIYNGSNNFRWNGPEASNYLGRRLTINDDGTRAIAPVPGNTTSNQKGRVYFLTIDASNGNFTAQQSIYGAANNDNLGVEVSINKDGDKALIGQQGSNGTNQGSVYYYTRSGSTWTQRQEITASDAVDNDRFCMPILSGDGTRAYIANKAGTVYTFGLSGSTWAEGDSTSYLPSSVGSGVTDLVQLAISEDGSTFAIGAETEGGTSEGRVYVYLLSYLGCDMLASSLPDGQSIVNPTMFWFCDATGTGSVSSGISMSIGGGSGEAEGNLRTWSRDGYGRCGGYLLGASTLITIDAEMGPVGSLAFYLGVNASDYSTGTVTIDLSGLGVEIVTGTTAAGSYSLSFTSDTVTVNYPASLPSQILWVNLTFASDATTFVSGSTIPITFE